jgi:hypothetical protein
VKLQRAAFLGAEITRIARGVKPRFAMPAGSNRGMTAGKMYGGDDGARTRDLCREKVLLVGISLIS